MDFLFFLLYLTSSFDLVGKLLIGGFSIRGFYLIELILFFLSLRKIKLKLFPGWNILLVWTFFIGVFVPNTTFLERNIGYFIWLLLSLLLLLLLPNTLTNSLKLFKHIKFYILSYVILALFGLLQFFLGIHGIDFFIRQWWIPYILPRLNGLSYEPSYYATYLVGGFSLLYWLTLVKKTSVFKNFKLQLFFTFLIGLVIILSGSRIGIIGIILTVLLHMSKNLLLLYKGILKKTFLKILISVIILIVVLILNLPNIKIFLTGTGLEGTPSHSVTTRLEEMKETFYVFLKNPLIGVSLGGIPSHRGEFHNIVVTNQEQAKKYEGMNVFIEVLAASGIVGFSFFILFWINLFYFHKKIIELVKNIKDYKVLLLKNLGESLFIMIFVESVCLMFNQNILRPYYWLSIAFYISTLILLKRIIVHYYAFFMPRR